MSDIKKEIIICMGSSCFSKGNNVNVEIIKNYFETQELSENIIFKGQLCTEKCNKGPAIEINGKQYFKVDKNNIHAILKENFEEIS